MTKGVNEHMVFLKVIYGHLLDLLRKLKFSQERRDEIFSFLNKSQDVDWSGSFCLPSRLAGRTQFQPHAM